MGHCIKKAPDIRIKHPVHTSPENAGMESVQRIVLAAPRSEPVGEPKEVEHVWLPFSTCRTLLGRMAAEADQPGFLRV